MAKTTPSRAKSKTPAPKVVHPQEWFTARFDALEKNLKARMDATAARQLKDLNNGWALATERIDALGQRLDKLASPTVAVEGLRDGDYTDASKEVADNLTAMGFAWHDKDRTVWETIRWMMSDCKMVNGSSIPPSTHCPPAVFLARAAVTAKALGLEPVDEAKVKAEAQAAEDAKLVFGARVEVKGRENEIWKIGCDEPTDEGYWRLCPSKCGNLNTMTAKRHEFTLLP